MTGWGELTEYVAKAYNQLSESDQNKCTVYAERNYGIAGAIHFYGKEYNLPDAITFLDSYVLWAPDSITNGPIIYIYRNINKFDEMFDTITEIGSVNNKYFREEGLKVFLCCNPKVNFQDIYMKKAYEEKSIYRRTATGL